MVYIREEMKTWTLALDPLVQIPASLSIYYLAHLDYSKS